MNLPGGGGRAPAAISEICPRALRTQIFSSVGLREQLEAVARYEHPSPESLTWDPEVICLSQIFESCMVLENKGWPDLEQDSAIKRFLVSSVFFIIFTENLKILKNLNFSPKVQKISG